MPASTVSPPSTPASREPAPEDHAGTTIPSVLRQACRAEAEAMWNELHLRLHADESRKAAFIDHIARDLMNKTTPRRRGQLLRRLTGEAAPTDPQAA